MLTLGSGTLYVATWVSGVNPASPATAYPSWTSIGEIGGDVEYDIGWQDKAFYGQSNFHMARGFYQGKFTIKAKKVEILPANMQVFTNIAFTSSAPNDLYTVAGTSKPVPMAVKFVHTRSDDATKTVTIYVWKAFANNTSLPFMREDISTVDIDFDAIADTSVTGGTAIARVEVTQ